MAKTIGEILRSARLEAGLSNRDVSRLTKLATGSISQIETSFSRDPGFSTVLKIARAIGISMEELAERFEGRSSASRGTGTVTAASLRTRLERAKVQQLQAAELIDATLDALHDDVKVVRSKR